MTAKILTIDIETSPNLAHVWGLWKQNVGINQIMQAGEVICYAAKWLGDPKVEFRSNFHDGHEVMIQRAWELFNEADALIHYNGNSFDVPWLKSEFALAGLAPPSPHKDIDLLATVKKQFRFPSNKLQYVSTALGLKGKVQHSGHDLWVRCMAGDEKAWNVMRRYNVQDVRLTEQLYERLLPWITGHPHLGLYAGLPDACANCGGNDLQKRGFAYTPLGVYQQLFCKDCGKWSRGGKRIEGADARGIG